MNKKWLLGIGVIAAISLPISTVVACGDTSLDGGKSALVSTGKIENISAAIVGSKNSYTLSFVESTDIVDKTALETSFKGMVAKATNDTKKITFTGSWDTTFDASKDETYTYTLKADGYNSVTFAVTVTGNAEKEATKLIKAAIAAKALALAATKETAIGFINRLTYPSQDDAAHNALLFKAIVSAKQAAINAINAATKEKVVSDMVSSATVGSEITKVISAIDAYNKSTGTDAKELVPAKERAIGFVNGIALPTQNDGLYDASLFGAIDNAKQSALNAINAATKEKVVSDMVSSATTGSEITKVISAIDAYNKSTGTIEKQADRVTLIEAINTAKGILDDILSRAKPGHDSSLLNGIHTTYQASIKKIESQTNFMLIKWWVANDTTGDESKKLAGLVSHYLTTKDSTKSV